MIPRARLLFVAGVSLFSSQKASEGHSPNLGELRETGVSIPRWWAHSLLEEARPAEYGRGLPVVVLLFNRIACVYPRVLIVRPDPA